MYAQRMKHGSSLVKLAINHTLTIQAAMVKHADGLQNEQLKTNKLDAITEQSRAYSESEFDSIHS